MDGYDVLVVGGGIAGVSIACELATDRRVALLDMEATLAFHTTGRSAATFLESYGGAPIRALTTASRAFLENPPDHLESSPLSPLPMLHIGRPGQAQVVEQLYREVRALVSDVQLLDERELLAVQPLLRPGYAGSGVLEPGSMLVDVHALHQGFVRGLRRRGGEIVTSARIVAAQRGGADWVLADAGGRRFHAPVVVDAAGSWVDQLAMLLGARPVGLRALRRTAFMIAAPGAGDTRGIPMTGDVDETFYVKPEGTQYLCSPADETEQEPGDARPDELEIARALDSINEALRLEARSVRSSWAGLRNFVADRTPVVGFDPAVEGLFWFGAQGGYGIQTAPALARTGAALLRGQPLPDDVASRGLTARMIAPDRPALRPAS